MQSYCFEHREPLLDPILLAIRVDLRKRQEQLWLGTEWSLRFALRGRDTPLYFACTRPLGAFWCEFGQVSEADWADAIWALSGALSGKKKAGRERLERTAAKLFTNILEQNKANAAVRYVAIQIWEMYLRCCRGQDRDNAAQSLRDYAQLLILPFGQYTPQMLHWKRDMPVMPVWNDDRDAKLEILYPQGGISFETAIVRESLRPALIYYRQRILDAGLLMRTCSQCGRIFFAPDTRSTLCSEYCRKASRKTSRQQFDVRSKGQEYEQAYTREYMFWYNRITKLKNKNAPQQQIEKAQAALKQFCKEALVRKQKVKQGDLSLSQFSSWMIGQEGIIREICGE